MIKFISNSLDKVLNVLIIIDILGIFKNGYAKVCYPDDI